MAHFAEIDENNIVIQVIVVPDVHESWGADWCRDNFGGSWVQTSYNAKIRKNFAGIGFIYDAEIDAFYTPQPFPSWSLDTNAQWQAPTPMPENENEYIWDETSRSWIVSSS